jgi:hypothetical protein
MTSKFESNHHQKHHTSVNSNKYSNIQKREIWKQKKFT